MTEFNWATGKNCFYQEQDHVIDDPSAPEGTAHLHTRNLLKPPCSKPAVSPVLLESGVEVPTRPQGTVGGDQVTDRLFFLSHVNSHIFRASDNLNNF